MLNFFKATRASALACGAVMFLACSDSSTGPLESPDESKGYKNAGEVSSSSEDDSVSGTSSSKKPESSSAVQSSSSVKGTSSAVSSSSSAAQSSSSAVSSSSSGESKIADSTYNAFTDTRDGNVYRVYSAGTQVWMAENLRYHDENSSPVLRGRHWEWKEGEYVYAFAAVMDDVACEEELCSISYPHRGLCPSGWHVPESSEWQTLVDSTENQGVSLFEESGFNAGWNYEYDARNRGVGEDGPGYRHARFWSATQNNAQGADEWYSPFNLGSASYFRSQGYSKKFGYALRCVADAGEVKLDKYKDSIVSSSSSTSSSSVASSSSISSSSLSSSSVASSSSVSSSSKWDPYSHGEDWNSLSQITDERDGNKYRIVQVNESLVWMAENLRYADSAATPALQGNMACIGANGERCEEGNLYTYAAAVNNLECASSICFGSYPSVQGICPAGWRLPKAADWSWLVYALNDGSISFDAIGMLPTGERNSSGGVKYDGYARYWLVDEESSGSAYEGYYLAGDHSLKKQSYLKAYGYAVRCVKNVEASED